MGDMGEGGSKISKKCVTYFVNGPKYHQFHEKNELDIIGIELFFIC